MLFIGDFDRHTPATDTTDQAPIELHVSDSTGQLLRALPHLAEESAFVISDDGDMVFVRIFEDPAYL